MSVWTVAVLIVALFVGAWEMLARDARLGPAFVDNKTLWADTRHQLNTQGSEAIVLLGGSRMQRAIDVEVMSERFDRPVFQLAVEGSSYLPVLEDLAVDPRISGTIVVSVTPALTFNRQLTQLDNSAQARYVENYRRQSLARRLDQKLTLFLQEHLALRAPRARPDIVLPTLIASGELPDTDFKTTFRNRVVHMDYDRMPLDQGDENIAEVYRQFVAPYSESEFAPFIDYIATITRMLRNKGATVYFVRLPSSGAVRALEDEWFPREEFWGVLEANVDATFIHYEDHPQLSGFMSQDGSHVDSQQIAEFTAEFVEVLASHSAGR